MRHLSHPFAIAVLLVLAVFCCVDVSASIRAGASAPVADPALADALFAAADSGEFDAARDFAQQQLAEATQLFLDGDLDDLTPLTDAAFATRALAQVERSSVPNPGATLGLLLDNPDLGRELTFILNDQDSMPGAYTVLWSIINARGGLEKLDPGDLDDDASLIAALCAVHDVERIVMRNSAMVVPPSADALYSYFSANRRRMMFDPRDMPPELLAHVVDASASIDELQWAARSYGGRANIGGLYFEIEYDNDAFGLRMTKLAEAGFNLPNIKRHGGVCVDQAHFASESGKAMGVPTAYATGRAIAGHAWVGFLRTDRRRARWDFSSGRYEVYQSMVARVTEPRSGRTVNESDIVLLQGLAGVSRKARHEARALAHASAFSSETRSGQSLGSITNELRLLRSAIERCPAIAELWNPITHYAERGELQGERLTEWGEAVISMAGKDYPGFAAKLLIPIAESMEDTKQRDRVLEHLIRSSSGFPDVVARVRLTQARRTQRQGDQAKAYDMFTYIAREYINEAPQALEALAEAKAMLIESDRSNYLPILLESVWQESEQPDTFPQISNWYIVGKQLAESLEQSGQTRKARVVRTQLSAR